MARLAAAATMVVLVGTAAFAQPPSRAPQTVRAAQSAQALPPELTETVNDFAGVIDAANRQRLDALIRALQRASGDVVVVATVDSVAPYADIQEYAVKMFENRGRGIGQRGRDNGMLVVIAVKERQVRVEVGYELEQFITDGLASGISRDVMAPEFRRGDYGAGLAAGVSALVERIAAGRNVVLQGAPVRRQARGGGPVAGGLGTGTLVTLFILFLVMRAIGGGRRRGFRGGRGWNSGIGPFGGGFGGGGFGGGGGGFGGGFGGFGGGRSGGGGGGGSW